MLPWLQGSQVGGLFPESCRREATQTGTPRARSEVPVVVSERGKASGLGPLAQLAIEIEVATELRLEKLLGPLLRGTPYWVLRLERSSDLIRKLLQGQEGGIILRLQVHRAYHGGAGRTRVA